MSILSVEQQTKDNNFGITSINDNIEPKKYQHQHQHLRQHQSQRQCDSNNINAYVVPKVKSLDHTHHKFRMIVCGDSGNILYNIYNNNLNFN